MARNEAVTGCPSVSATSATLANTLVIGGRTVDGRTVAARRYKAVCSDLASDLGHPPNAGELLIIQRAAALAIQAEQLEAAIVAGESADAELHLKITNTLNRTLAALGLRTKDGKTAKVIDEFASAIINGE